MNIIEAIEITRDVAASNWHADDEQRTAMEMVADLIAAYDALAPDWTQAPNGATHFVINAEGYGEWLFGVESKHQVAIIGTKWSKRYVWSTEPVGYIDLPLGIDWRLCKWERP